MATEIASINQNYDEKVRWIPWTWKNRLCVKWIGCVCVCVLDWDETDSGAVEPRINVSRPHFWKQFIFLPVVACFLVATLVLVPSLFHTSSIMCHVLLNGCRLQRVPSTSVVHKHVKTSAICTCTCTNKIPSYIVLVSLSCMAGCCHSEWD